MNEVHGIMSAPSHFDLYLPGHITHELPHVNAGELAEGIKKVGAVGKANPPE